MSMARRPPLISAVAGGGTFAVAYLDGATAIGLDPSVLTASAGSIEWYDPSTGARILVKPNADLRRLVVPHYRMHQMSKIGL